ncbi:MAG: hypothetical protein PF487_01215 [Bacteroidales bacterium]|jgi:predicted ATP-binding protein involved in virulence|nr:hypothetical protein [Bacteroidales bacterium]
MTEKKKALSTYNGRIDSIHIVDTGIIKDLEIEFKDKNVILGEGGSGKTTILGCVKKKLEETAGDDKVFCVIIDDALAELEDVEKKIYLRSLLNLEGQVIITARGVDERFFDGFNVIRV